MPGALDDTIKLGFMNNNTHKHSSVLLNALHTDFKKIYASISKENWNKQLALYLHKIKFFGGNTTDERMVSGWIAALCERAYYVAAHEKPINVRLNFERQLKEIIKFTSLPKFLSCPGPVICGKCQPSFIESVIPTLERFRVMERLPEVFSGGVDAIIVGGSMSYIPFFGIRENPKNRDFSDIDTLIVINDNFFKKAFWHKFISDDFFPSEEKKKFLRRIRIFRKLLRQNAVDVFSQRFSIIGKPFTISNHFVTRSVFRRMVYADLKKSLRARSDQQYIMRDFRVGSFSHPCHARHTFDGERFESVIDGHEIKSGGFISNMPGYIISNGKFYPGVYHTVISPALLVFYDRTGETTKLVKKFENILYQEVKNTRKNFSSATYAKAHNRYDIFPPGRYDEGHNSYVSPKEIKKYLPNPDFSVVKIESVILPGEAISYERRDLKNNERVRDEAWRVLEKWNKKTLENVEIEVKNFIDQGNFEILMSSAKKQGCCWYTVTTIPRAKKLIRALPCPYKQGNTGDLIVRKELFTQIITPGDIMRLNAYEKLSQISGKVYVASIMDPAEASKNLPISYALVILIPS
jgi:hypothetical protein